MKTTISLAARVLAIALVSAYTLSVTACSKETNVTLPDTGIQPANGYISSGRFNISFVVSVPCANNGRGEDVFFEGTLHETFHVTVNNNRFLLKIIANPREITGTGQITGNKYEATGETEQAINQSFTNGQVTIPYVNNFKITGPEKNSSFLIRENAHITVNANGTATASIDNFSEDCEGNN
ncbi:MAG TPA: hypothetical protein VH396_08720 [Chitinophagaceae bacterium]|jgi:hypothetical protein